ncbi:MAG: putative sulfate exporter family transporter, partial [Candidatus Sericytochromatia bacterium]
MNKYIKGLSVASVIGILSVLIASIPSIKSALNINPLVIATLIGLVIGNSIKFDESYKSGLTFSMKKV